MAGLNLPLTDEQDKALEAYAKHNDISKRAAAIRLLTQALANEMNDATLAAELPRPGGWRGNAKSLENLVHYADKLTDKCRSDPTEPE